MPDYVFIAGTNQLTATRADTNGYGCRFGTGTYVRYLDGRLRPCGVEDDEEDEDEDKMEMEK
jgi:hypothetical protein